MTKQEAIQALKEGYKVRHKLFSNDEFFELRSGKDWEDGWLIID